MARKLHDFAMTPFPRERQAVIDAGRLGRGRHIIHGLVEFDVTASRDYIRAARAGAGARISLTAFVIACLGRAVAEDRGVQAYRDWLNRLIAFDDVDVMTMIEVEIDGRKVPMPHIIRAANRKTAEAITAELQAAQTNREASAGWRFLQSFTRLPGFARTLVYWVWAKNPHWIREHAGTVGMTSLGMFRAGSGWGIGMPIHTLSVTVGGIAEKPGVVAGNLAVRKYMAATISFDHDIVDGAPAARLVARFRRMIESGHGL